MEEEEGIEECRYRCIMIRVRRTSNGYVQRVAMSLDSRILFQWGGNIWAKLYPTSKEEKEEEEGNECFVVVDSFCLYVWWIVERSEGNASSSLSSSSELLELE